MEGCRMDVLLEVVNGCTHSLSLTSKMISNPCTEILVVVYYLAPGEPRE